MKVNPETARACNKEQSVISLIWLRDKEARHRGVLLDPVLSFDAQGTEVVQSCFVQLRQLTKIGSFRPSAYVEKLLHALSPPDYCHTL